jgi:hypothetical protein
MKIMVDKKPSTSRLCLFSTRIGDEWYCKFNLKLCEASKCKILKEVDKDA